MTTYKRRLKRDFERQLFSLTFPNEISVTYDDIFDLDNEKAVLTDIINYLNTNDKQSVSIKPHMSYHIVGPIGTGKASLVYATAKASNAPVITIDAGTFVGGYKDTEVKEKLDWIFKNANSLKKQFNSCFIMMKSLEELNASPNNSIFYLSLVENCKKSDNVFIFGLSVEEFDVPAAVIEANIFTTMLNISYPTLTTREKIFECLIKKLNVQIADDVSINRLARDTIGETMVSINYIIKEAQLFAIRQGHEQITQSDFYETIVKLDAGEKSAKMTEKEKKLTAYHEAGHVIAGYFTNPDYKLKSVEITPRTLGSLGLTMTDADESKYSYFKEDLENIIIELFGGMCAEELLFDSHTSGVISDLSSATYYATNMVRAYGMDEDFGPIVFVPNVTDSLFMQKDIEEHVRVLLKGLKVRTRKVIDEHEKELTALANALIDKESIVGNEIEEIFKSIKA